MSEPYCGIKIPAKGKRRGSMKECADKGEIRYYGIKRVDPKLIEYAQSSRKGKESRESLIKKLVTFRGRLRVAKRDYEEERDKKTRAEIRENISKLQIQINEISKMIKKNQSRQSSRSRRSRRSRGSRRSRRSSIRRYSGSRRSRGSTGSRMRRSRGSRRSSIRRSRGSRRPSIRRSRRSRRSRGSRGSRSTRRSRRPSRASSRSKSRYND